MIELSDDSADKLQACLNHDWTDPDGDFLPDYVAACQKWYAALSASDRVVVASVIGRYTRRDRVGAIKMAGALPPAPKFPPP